jgi:hypothetical protein
MSMAFPFLRKLNHPIIHYHCIRYLALWIVIQQAGMFIERSAKSVRASIVHQMQGWDVGIRIPSPSIVLNDVLIAVGCAVVYCGFTFRRKPHLILLGNLGLSPLRLAAMMVAMALLLDSFTWSTRM